VGGYTRVGRSGSILVLDQESGRRPEERRGSVHNGKTTSPFNVQSCSEDTYCIQRISGGGGCIVVVKENRRKSETGGERNGVCFWVFWWNVIYKGHIGADSYPTLSQTGT